MKIKLSSEEVFSLCQAVSIGADKVDFVTTYESRLTGAVLKSFLRKLSTRDYQPGKKTSIKLSNEELLVLNYVLPQIPHSDPYTQMVLTELINIINPACLGLS